MTALEEQQQHDHPSTAALAAPAEDAFAKLPPPFSNSLPFSRSNNDTTTSNISNITTPTAPIHLIAQGAEALLFRTSLLTPLPSSQPAPATPPAAAAATAEEEEEEEKQAHRGEAALKLRPRKAWRHPTLDRRLTRQRILAEARVLVKCARPGASSSGVAVPALLALDWEHGWLATEWIAGSTVKGVLRGLTAEQKQEGEGLRGLLRRVGAGVGALHASGVVHGDLTTSNMMLRPGSMGPEEAGGEGGQGASRALDDGGGEVVLIDFGLATQSVSDEDRAVDLYVLERAFGSTHPGEEHLFPVVLEGYGASFKGARSALRKLEDVRMRGRKKSMLG